MRCHDVNAEGFVPVDYAKQVYLGAAMYQGMDKAEALAIWRRASKDSDDGEDAREMVATVTNGEIEIFVE